MKRRMYTRYMDQQYIYKKIFDSYIPLKFIKDCDDKNFCFYIAVPKTGSKWLLSACGKDNFRRNNNKGGKIIYGGHCVAMSKSSLRIFKRELDGKCPVAPPINNIYMNGSFRSPINKFYLKYGPLDFNKYLFFSVVRNPFDHLVSIYFYGWSRGRGGKNMAENFKTFDDFIKGFYDQSPKINSPYFNRFLYFQWFKDNGSCIVDYALRNENLNTGLFLLMRHFGINIKDVKRGENPEEGGVNAKRDRDYRKYYTDKSREMVEEKCSRELLAFGYNFEGHDNRLVLNVSNINYDPYRDKFEIKKTK